MTTDTGESGAVVADDHLSVLNALANMVAAAGFTVVGTAGTWTDAVVLARQHHPQLVLMDVNMPPGSALDAIGPLREASPASKIVLISAGANDDIVAHQAGELADGFISKLDSPKKIVAALRAHHDEPTATR